MFLWAEIEVELGLHPFPIILSGQLKGDSDGLILNYQFSKHHFSTCCMLGCTGGKCNLSEHVLCANVSWDQFNPLNDSTKYYHYFFQYTIEAQRG